MANHNIDTLGIKITSDAQSANRSIDTLINHLGSLSATLKGLENTTGFSKLSKGLTDLASSMKAITQKDVGSFTKVTNNIQKFNKVDHEGINNVAQSIGILSSSLSQLSSSAKDVKTTSDSIHQMAASLKTLQGTKATVDSMTQLTMAFSRLSSASTESAAVLPAFASGMKSAVNTLSNAKTVSDNLISMTNAMGNLANGLGVLSASATSVSQIVMDFGMSLKNVISDITSLGTVDQTIIDMTNSLASLANGMKVLVQNSKEISVVLPQLGKALKEVMQILSTAPEVSQSVVKMTEALANLAKSIKGVTGNETVGASGKSGFSFLGKAAKEFGGSVIKTDKQLGGLIQKIRSFASNSEKAQSSVSKFASAVGTLYVKFWLLARVVGKVWKSIESSMNYLETLNYFNSAFGQVAERAVNNFREAGYESANAYYDSFQARAKQLTKKMSGFEVDEKGNMKRSGIASLGIDPNSVMNYQAMFAQMSSSMGVASENALVLSNVLTEIGADLASVKNLNFEDVWKDMASGLTGMSRTLDKYGVNIRNANLNQKLMQLGIDTTVNKLSQADKALLRTIVLLESTTYAWGDLSRTLNTPANQIRMLTANLRQLGRMIGSLFLPLVQKLLPYINGLVIAMQRLVSVVAALFGIDMSKFLQNTGASNEAISDILDESDNLGDSIDDAAENAKKLKNHLLGIDELNVINESDQKADTEMPEYSGLLNDAFLDAVKKYQAAWDDAFKKLENNSEKIADKIEAWAKRAFKPIGEAWDEQGKYVKDSFANMLKSISNLVGDIARDWSTVWYQPKTKEVFENIFASLGNIFSFIGNIADKIDEAWNHANNGLRILQSLRDIILEITKGVNNITAELARWAKEDLSFVPLFDAFANALETIADKMTYVRQIAEDFNKTFVEPLVEHFIEVSLPNLVKVFDDFLKKIDWEKLKKNLHLVWEGLEHIGEVVLDGIVLAIKDFADAVADFINSKTFQDLVQKFHDWAMTLTAQDIASLVEKIVKALLLFKAVSIVSSIIGAIASKFSFLGTIISGLVNLGQFHQLKKLIEGVTGKKTIELETKGVGEALEKTNKLNEVWKTISSTIGAFIIKLAGIGAVVGGSTVAVKGFLDLWNDGFSLASELAFGLGTAIAGVGAVLLGLNPVIAAVAGVAIFAIGNIVVWAKEHWGELKDSWTETWDKMTEYVDTNVSQPIQDFIGNLADGVKAWFGNIGNWASEFVAGVETFFEGIGTKFSNFGTSVAETWGKVSKSVAQHWDNIKQSASEMVDNAKQKIAEWVAAGWEKITEKANNLEVSLAHKWSNIKESTKIMVDDFKQKISEWASNKWDDLESNLKIAVKIVSDKWQEVKDGFKTFRDNYMPQILEWADGVKENAEEGLEKVRIKIAEKWGEVKTNFDEFAEPYVQATKEWVEKVFPNVSEAFEKVKTAVTERLDKMKSNFDEFAEPYVQATKEWVEKVFPNVSETFEKVKTAATERVDKMKSNFDEFVSDFIQKKDIWLQAVRDETPKAFETMDSAIKGKWQDISKYASEFFPKLGDDLFKFGQQISDRFGEGVNNIGSKVESAIGSAKKTVENNISQIRSWVDSAVDKIKDIKESIQNISFSSSKSSWRIPKYATGGFPEDGLFFANHTELVGKFNNGKSAVVNNEQIISGIESATYSAFMRASNDSQGREEALLEELIRAVKDGRKISIDGRDIVTAYDNRKSRNGYAF